jgi:S-DNA-T family DNA segregation ATPase FtsK/SpoIIIE
MIEYVNLLKTLIKKINLDIEIKNCKKENAFLIFDLVLNNGSLKKFQSSSTEIALILKALSEPLIYPITKDGIVRMELMISEQPIVYFKDIYKCIEEQKLPLILGKSRDGSPLIMDLAELPHLLISGSTGSGKSILLHSIINGLLLNSSTRLVLIDPKRVEFSYYDKLPELVHPIGKDIKTSISILQYLIDEMEFRFNVLEKYKARDISNYKKYMPYIVLIIDEFADLMMASKKEVQELVCKLAQKSRACGIHLIISTQRPSVNVITGIIKANFSARISCKVSASVDSRTILDRNGAETLTGKGDAIINCNQYSFKRFKGAFIDEKDIIKNIKYRGKIWNS